MGDSLTFFFFFNDTATTEIYTLSLHDALPISVAPARVGDADHGHRDHPGRGFGAHDRLVRLLDGAGADVALGDLRPVFRGGRPLQRPPRAGHRDGGAPPVPPPPGGPPPRSIPQSCEAYAGG